MRWKTGSAMRSIVTARIAAVRPGLRSNRSQELSARSSKLPTACATCSSMEGSRRMMLIAAGAGHSSIHSCEKRLSYTLHSAHWWIHPRLCPARTSSSVRKLPGTRSRMIYRSMQSSNWNPKIPMRAVKLLTLSCLFASPALAQQINFPGEITDQAALPRVMPRFAKAVIAFQQAGQPPKPASLFKAQLVAGLYADALANLDRLRAPLAADPAPRCVPAIWTMCCMRARD